VDSQATSEEKRVALAVLLTRPQAEPQIGADAEDNTNCTNVNVCLVMPDAPREMVERRRTSLENPYLVQFIEK
jgi:hypothetical protein